MKLRTAKVKVTFAHSAHMAHLGETEKSIEIVGGFLAYI